jgi:hypothetical protein
VKGKHSVEIDSGHSPEFDSLRGMGWDVLRSKYVLTGLHSNVHPALMPALVTTVQYMLT